MTTKTIETVEDAFTWLVRERPRDAVECALKWKVESERLRKLFDDAGQGEHDVLALIDHYQERRQASDDELAALRIQVERLQVERDCAMRAVADAPDLIRKANSSHILVHTAMWEQMKADRDESRIDEREACAKVCIANARKYDPDDVDDESSRDAHMADARDIRARGKP